MCMSDGPTLGALVDMIDEGRIAGSFQDPILNSAGPFDTPARCAELLSLSPPP
jgi:hypothetical protein